MSKIWSNQVRNKCRTMYVEGRWTLADISKKTGVGGSTLRTWKADDNWSQQQIDWDVETGKRAQKTVTEAEREEFKYSQRIMEKHKDWAVSKKFSTKYGDQIYLSCRDLHNEGWTLKKIAANLKVSYNTIAKWKAMKWDKRDRAIYKPKEKETEIEETKKEENTSDIDTTIKKIQTSIDEVNDFIKDKSSALQPHELKEYSIFMRNASEAMSNIYTCVYGKKVREQTQVNVQNNLGATGNQPKYDIKLTRVPSRKIEELTESPEMDAAECGTPQD